MNVALLVEAPFPPVSRANLRLYKLGLALDRKGYEVYLVSPSLYPHSRRQDACSNIHVLQHIGLAAFLYASFIRIPVVFLHLVASTIALIRLHKRLRVCVIHAWHPVAGLAAVLAGRLTEVRVFLDWTDFYSDIVRHESRLLTGIAQVVERFIIGNCDMIFTISDEMKRALIEIGALGDKVCVIPDGVDPVMFNPEIDGLLVREKYGLGDSPTIIFHGDVKPIDGVDILIRAFTLVLKLLPNVKLLVVGGGRKCFGEVVRLAEKLGVDSSMIFAGWVPHESVPEYIAAANVGVMPLRSTLETNCYLSFKLFEYWAVGKPVVVSRVKAISNVIKNGLNGILVKPEDVEGLAEALVAVLSDQGRARLMGENGRKVVENAYNWDILMEEEAKHYDKFLRSGKFGDPI